MQLSVFYATIKDLAQPVFQTRDIVALLHMPPSTVSKALRRLAKHNHLVSIQRNLWGLPEKIDPLMLPEYLTAPYPSYISLQSALYHHGMIEQIPQVIYAVSLMRTKKVETSLGNFSLHHLPPEFYFGYESIGTNNIKMATPEKALLDFFYLSPAKTRLFVSLPELELPKNFNYKQCEFWLKKIPAKTRRKLVEKKLMLL